MANEDELWNLAMKKQEQRKLEEERSRAFNELLLNDDLTHVEEKKLIESLDIYSLTELLFAIQDDFDRLKRVRDRIKKLEEED